MHDGGSQEELEQLQDLLMEGACSDDPEKGKALIDEALRRGASFTADRVQPLSYAAMCGRAGILAHLIARGATMAAEWPNNISDAEGERGDSALHEAAQNGDLLCLEILLAADGGQFLNRFNELSWTPLIAAVEKGHLKAVRLLIAAGADINAHDEPRIGDTAIKRAVEERNLEIVRVLLEAGADPTIPGWVQMSALDRARDGGEETREILHLILEHLPRS
jgi:ankyrin repeat protein